MCFLLTFKKFTLSHSVLAAGKCASNTSQTRQDMLQELKNDGSSCTS